MRYVEAIRDSKENSPFEFVIVGFPLNWVSGSLSVISAPFTGLSLASTTTPMME
jgi:hypothetical protein